MTDFKKWVVGAMVVLSALVASAFTSSDADTIFNAYNTAFYVTNGGNAYYKMNTGTGTGAGWWTFAEEIEMAEDAYDSSPTAARQNIVATLCNGFISKNGSSWMGNDYNDDIAWAVIAFSRAYLITGNSNFRNIAKANFDGMYSRGWDTTFAGGGLWWRIDKQGKNACVNGPGAIAACYLYSIYGDSSYLRKAQDCYAWERQVLFHSDTGAIDDSIGTNYVHNTWASSYNQGTFIGAGNFLYQATGLPFYYQDAVLAERFSQNNICSGGIFPEYGSGDFGGFNGILARWAARFAKDQNLWGAFGPWLISNANAAWSVRNTNNLAWQKWRTATPAGTNVLDSWDCSDSVVIMSVALTNTLDTLRITPAIGFTAVTQLGKAPNPTSLNLVLTNTSAAALNWSAGTTSTWLNVSVSTGTLPAGSPAATVQVSINPTATTNLAAGYYYTSVWLTNLTSGAKQSRSFRLIVSSANVPIAMTGYNAGVLAPNTATAGVPGAMALDIPNNYCLYQAGLNGSARGLPPDGVFTSQIDATVFQFMPYGVSTNALIVGYGYPNSATFTLATPQAYKSLAILACSVNTSANGGTGTFVMNFANGTQSQVFNFSALDWFGSATNMAIQGIGRLKRGLSAGEDNGAVNPRLFQTTIDLAALGVNQTIASITFTKPANAGSQQSTAVFAVSGLLAYREPIIIQQPAPSNLFRFAGASNVWTVAANAGLPVYYSWCLNGAAIPTETNATLQLSGMQTTDSGNYTVVISNAFGVVTSSVASLTVVPAPGYPLAQAVLTDGALGYWRLDEASGTVARDYVGGNNGTYSTKVLLGQPGYNLLDTHKAARFGYLSSSNSCVTNIAVDFGSSSNAIFSVEAWVNGGVQTTDAGMVAKGYGSGGEQFNLDCGGGNHGFRFFVRDASGSARVASSSVAPNGQWHHLVGVCDQLNGYVYLYVDGARVAQATIGTNSGILSSSYPVSIGSRQSGLGTAYDNQFVGSMEEVAIYGYALSSSQVQAHYQAAANRSPVFSGNPFTMAGANAGLLYSGSLATAAIDPNGDAITFAKVSGPAWLSVNSNGFLSGTPLSGNVGLNAFIVRATDPSGLYTTATMNLVVAAAPPIVSSAVLQGNNLLLNWVGGIAPYQVQMATNLTSPVWQNFGVPTSVNSLLVASTNGAAFYRIYGQ